MKILGIVFQSSMHLNKLSLFCDKVESLQEGITRATIAVTNEQGQFGWIPIITTIREIADPVDIAPAPIKIDAPKKIVEGKETISWVMKTIITNKDKALLKAVKRYMTEPEVLFVEDAIK